MKIVKYVDKDAMNNAMKLEAKQLYSACGSDCPRCRISDG